MNEFSIFDKLTVDIQPDKSFLFSESFHPVPEDQPPICSSNFIHDNLVKLIDPSTALLAGHTLTGQQSLA